MNHEDMYGIIQYQFSSPSRGHSRGHSRGRYMNPEVLCMSKPGVVCRYIHFHDTLVLHAQVVFESKAPMLEWRKPWTGRLIQVTPVTFKAES